MPAPRIFAGPTAARAAVVMSIGLAHGCARPEPEVDALEQESAVLEPPAPTLQSQDEFDLFMLGTYVYEGMDCSFVHPETATRHLFSCDRIAAGVADSVSSADLRRLVDAVGLGVDTLIAEAPWTTVIIRVPPESEREGLAQARASGLFKWVELVWAGGMPLGR